MDFDKSRGNEAQPEEKKKAGGHDSVLEELLTRNNRSVMQSVIFESDHEDLRTYPLSEPAFSWEVLNQDFHSTHRNHKDVEVMARFHKDEEMDLRRYMIERPLSVSVFDKFPKILNLFRQMQLR